MESKLKRKLVLYDFEGVFVEMHDLIAAGGKPGEAGSNFEKLSQLEMKDGMREVVKEMSADYTQVIVASAHSDDIKFFLELNGLSKYFFIIYGGDVGDDKARMIRSLLETCGVKITDSIFVTDNLSDIDDARTVGIPSIAVTWGEHDAFTLRKAVPASIVKNADELKFAIHRYLA